MNSNVVDSPVKIRHETKVIKINPNKIKDGESIIIKNIDFKGFKIRKLVFSKNKNGEIEIIPIEHLEAFSEIKSLFAMKQLGIINESDFERYRDKLMEKMFS